MRAHLRTANASYPACGAIGVPPSALLEPMIWLDHPPEDRCRRCARSLLGEGYIKAALRRAHTSTGDE